MHSDISVHVELTVMLQHEMATLLKSMDTDTKPYKNVKGCYGSHVSNHFKMECFIQYLI